MTSDTIDALCTKFDISQSLASRLMTANFAFDKTTVGGLSSSIFWTKQVVKIPDYAGVSNIVFVGVIPSGGTNYTSVIYPSKVTGNQTLRGYDYSYFLAAQKLEPQNYVLLKWADQQSISNHTFNLAYDNSLVAFTVGNRVRGNSSGDAGTIIYKDNVQLLLKGISGTAPYFDDNENLYVGTIQSAKADGSAIDVSGTIVQVYPENFILQLLGQDSTGTNWAKVTGIYPKYFASSGSVWGSTIPEVEFDFNANTTKLQAIEQICQYMKWVFYIGNHVEGGVPTPCAYFVPEADIDNVTYGIGLPSPVYVTSTSDYNASDARKHLISPFILTQAGENQYNWVIVRCQGLKGQWFQAQEYDSDVYDPIYNSGGTEPKRVYYEENPNIATQADCSARAADIWTYYQKQVCTWKATFRLRSDFVLLQRLIISGYSPAIEDGTYRIIGINYRYENGGTINEVTVDIILDSDFKAYLNLKRVYLNSVFEVQNIVKDMLNKSLVSWKGTVTVNTDGGTVLVSMDGYPGAPVMRVSDPSGGLQMGNTVIVSTDSSGKLVASRAV